METTTEKKLRRDVRHHHFWILDGILFESYTTIRGMRYFPRLEVPGMPDSDNCTEAMIIYIEKEYLN